MTARKVWMAAAFLFCLFAGLAGFFVLRVQWVPHFDFDIIGMAWVFSNAAPLGLIALLIICALMALYCAMRAYRVGR